MLIKNTGLCLITIAEVQIVPGKVEELADEYKNHPIIEGYVKVGKLQIVAETNVAEAAATASSEGDEDKFDLKKMKKADLIAYAEEKKVDLTGANTVAEIIALIEAAEQE